jgi:23S rRNA pseudouridine2605 synthase
MRGSFSDKPKRRSSSSSSFRKEESSFSDRPKKTFRSKEEGLETFKERRTATSDRPRKVYRDTDSSAPEGRRSYSSKNTKEERSTAFDKKARPERSSGGYKKDIKKSFDSDDLKKGRKSYSKKIDRIGKGKKYTPSKQTEDSSIRLNKYISNSGICSRREADQLIIEGLVQVNGVVITELGHKVQPGDSVKYNNKVIRPESLVYVLLNKPKDFITTMDDEGGRKTVMDLVANATKERIFPVGRLDRNTTGLLLLTNDGELTQKLTHPSFKIKKIYEVELNESITPEEFERLQKSHITLYDGPVKIDDIAIISPNRKILGIEIHEGRNRIVRRVFESLGKEVVRLDRVMYAGLTKKNLPRGKWRFLTNSEVNQMKYLL